MILKKNVHVAFIGIPVAGSAGEQRRTVFDTKLVVPENILNAQIQFVFLVVFQFDGFAKVPFKL